MTDVIWEQREYVDGLRDPLTGGQAELVENLAAVTRVLLGLPTAKGTRARVVEEPTPVRPAAYSFDELDPLPAVHLDAEPVTLGLVPDADPFAVTAELGFDLPADSTVDPTTDLTIDLASDLAPIPTIRPVATEPQSWGQISGADEDDLPPLPVTAEDWAALSAPPARTTYRRSPSRRRPRRPRGPPGSRRPRWPRSPRCRRWSRWPRWWRWRRWSRWRRSSPSRSRWSPSRSRRSSTYAARPRSSTNSASSTTDARSPAPHSEWSGIPRKHDQSEWGAPKPEWGAPQPAP